MLMMDYTSQYTSSTMGSDTMSASGLHQHHHHGGGGGGGSTSSNSNPNNRRPSAATTMASSSTSSASTSNNSRIRTVRLVRPSGTGMLPPPGLTTCRHGPSLGFSVRGGREHGTGFFVSVVEHGSEAHRQGLRIGDQIVRINGFTIEDAVHKEVLQLISNHTHLTLKVRSVGIIPVKDRKTDPLSWQIISTDCSSSTRSSPQLSEKNHDVRISIMVAPRSKLGCGICKGPDWKPGIFIQFTKEGGISREAGLRPGDQILYCNGIDFSDIPFNEAVSLMKTSRQLDLIIRKSAGSELFPGESSGYNSSASSVTGDQSPSWSKRLSIVKEESMDLEDRLSHLDTRFKSKKWEKIEWDDMEQDSERAYGMHHFKPTIINLSENGTTIKNNGSIAECQEFEEEQAMLDYDDDYDNYDTQTLKAVKISDTLPQQHELKTTVVADVHRSDNNPVEEILNKTEHIKLSKSVSTGSFSSVASRSSTISATTSLSSAISQEILRRTEKSKLEEKPSIDEQLQMKKILKGVDSDKQQQHSQLMDEFRKAHRRMFKSPEEECKHVLMKSDLQSTNTDRNNAINKDFNQKVSERLSGLPQQEETFREMSTNPQQQQQQQPLKQTLNQQESTNAESRRMRNASAGVTVPPPPPPFPLREATSPHTPTTNSTPQNKPPQCNNTNKFNNHLNNLISRNTPNINGGKAKAPPPPVPIKTSVLSHHIPPAPSSTNGLSNGNTNLKSTGKFNSNNQSNGQSNGNSNNQSNGQSNGQFNGHSNGNSNGIPAPPPCPTPDYDTLSLSSTSTLSRKLVTLKNGPQFTKPSQTLNKVAAHNRSNSTSSNVSNNGTNINGDSVDMESLESFQLNRPYDTNPRPPSTYFSKQRLTGQLSNGGSVNGNTNTVKRRPVSVTIGEYPSGTTRRTPGKLEFLQQQDECDGRNGEKQGVNNQFASELAMTLSRSNLKKRTESMENILNHPQIRNQSNGSVRISVNNSTGSNGLTRRQLARSTNDLNTLSSLDSISRAFASRVTINIPSNAASSSGDSSCSSSISGSTRGGIPVAPSGILKNTSGCQQSSFPPTAHKPVVQQKSITFGDMPTVINDQLRVT